jgi:hypothetical protein
MQVGGGGCWALPSSSSQSEIKKKIQTILNILRDLCFSLIQLPKLAVDKHIGTQKNIIKTDKFVDFFFFAWF